jgi:hypothetical protein
MTGFCAHRTAGVSRVLVWRGDVRLSMSVSAPFEEREDDETFLDVWCEWRQGRTPASVLCGQALKNRVADCGIAR